MSLWFEVGGSRTSVCQVFLFVTVRKVVKTWMACLYMGVQFVFFRSLGWWREIRPASSTRKGAGCLRWGWARTGWANGTHRRTSGSKVRRPPCIWTPRRIGEWGSPSRLPSPARSSRSAPHCQWWAPYFAESTSLFGWLAVCSRLRPLRSSRCSSALAALGGARLQRQ